MDLPQGLKRLLDQTRLPLPDVPSNNGPSVPHNEAWVQVDGMAHHGNISNRTYFQDALLTCPMPSRCDLQHRLEHVAPYHITGTQLFHLVGSPT